MAETIADDIWREVVRWDWFARDVVGKQLAKAADSIGANIAETYGRFYCGEKLQFLNYARGSLFETKYWLNRALARELMSYDQVQKYAAQLTNLVRQLNAFASTLKSQRRGDQTQPKAVREAVSEYVIDWLRDAAEPLFIEDELEWLETVPQYPISNT